MKLEHIKTNFTRIQFESKDMVLWFSYETLICIEVGSKVHIIKNYWAQTTGKHLNYINDDKSIRISREEFNEIARGLGL